MFFCAGSNIAGIDGQVGMKLIYGIIVVEGRANQGRAAKVCPILQLTSSIGFLLYT